MRVFLSSTSEDLKPYRRAAADVVLEAQGLPVRMEDFPADPRRVVDLCRDKVRGCDLVLLLVAFRRGWVPRLDQGGDGEKSITAYEIEAADQAPPIPVLAFLAKDSWPIGLSDDEPVARASVKNFRAELNRNAKFFEPEKDPDLPVFKSLIRDALANFKRRPLAMSPPAILAAPGAPGLRLRPPAELPLPTEPYPLLGPYENPATFGGRDAEVTRLAILVQQPPLVLCLHAASGAGKSSLLLAGLAPRLRSEGHLVSVERSPGDAGLAAKVLGDLLENADPPSDDDPRLPEIFADLVSAAQQQSGKKVVLVLDQLDDVLRKQQGKKESLARIGLLLAATAQRLPGGQGYAAKWVLSYRHEFHGEVRGWLSDVLAEARQVYGDGFDFDLLPYELDKPDKSHEWQVPLMGQLAPGDTSQAIPKRAFREAITKPLDIQNGGQPLFGVSIAGDGADRLAAAFAGERLKQRDAPLVPELQVVLSHLLPPEEIRQAAIRQGQPLQMQIPPRENLGEEIGGALARHLERALERLFPVGRDAAKARLGRTCAVLALRSLADAEGRRGEGMDRAELVAMLGSDGGKILDGLASAEARLVVETDGRCSLSHDRLAEVVSHLVRNEAARGNLLLDRELIDLQRKIGQKEALFASDPKDAGARSLTRAERRLIASNQGTLLFDEGRRNWWLACQDRLLRRRFVGWGLTAAAMISVVVLLLLFPANTVTSTSTRQLRNASWQVSGHWAVANLNFEGKFVVWDLRQSRDSWTTYQGDCGILGIGVTDVGCIRPDGRIHIWPLGASIELESEAQAKYDSERATIDNLPSLRLSKTERIAVFSNTDKNVYLWDGTRDPRGKVELFYPLAAKVTDRINLGITPRGRWIKIFTPSKNLLIARSESQSRRQVPVDGYVLSDDETSLVRWIFASSEGSRLPTFELFKSDLDNPVRLELPPSLPEFTDVGWAMTPDNKTFSLIASRSIVSWDLDSVGSSLPGKLIQDFFDRAIRGVQFWIDPTSTWAAASGAAGQFYLWKLADPPADGVRPLFRDSAGFRPSLGFSPDGDSVAVSLSAGTFLWQPGSTPQTSSPISHQQNARFHFSKDGAALLSVDPNSVYVISVAERHLQKLATTESKIQAVVVRPDRKELAILTENETVLVSKCWSLWGVCLKDVLWPDFGGPLVMD
jgi:WD40 repeat protein